MQDHYWNHDEARWVHHVAPVELPEPRDPAAAPVAEAVPAVPEGAGA
jgi:hypothetical protein